MHNKSIILLQGNRVKVMLGAPKVSENIVGS